VADPQRQGDAWYNDPQSSNKRYDQQVLLDIASYGERDYKDALEFWGMDTTLYDTLYKSLVEYSTVATRREDTNFAGIFLEGDRQNNIFVNPTHEDNLYTEDQILAHELGHFFKKHKFESIDWDHKLLDFLFKPFGGYFRAHVDTAGWEDVSSEKFNEMFFPIAEKVKEGQFDEYKQIAKKKKSLGIKLPKSLDY
jgi:hypothetical protein